MKAYILAVAGAVLFSAIFSAILPEGKMGKFLKGICGIFVFAAVVLPLGKMLTGRELSLSAGEIGTDESYLAACARLLEEKDEESAEAMLLSDFSLNATAEAERGTEEGFPLRKITVNICSDGIFGQEEHIDMAERIKTALEEKFGCTAEVVWVE